MERKVYLINLQLCPCKASALCIVCSQCISSSASLGSQTPLTTKENFRYTSDFAYRFRRVRDSPRRPPLPTYTHSLPVAQDLKPLTDLCLTRADSLLPRGSAGAAWTAAPGSPRPPGGVTRNPRPVGTGLDSSRQRAVTAGPAGGRQSKPAEPPVLRKRQAKCMAVMAG